MVEVFTGLLIAVVTVSSLISRDAESKRETAKNPQ